MKFKPLLGIPGKLADALVESAVIAATGATQLASWVANINRIRILGFTKRRYPECFKQLDGGDKRILRAFLDPETASNTFSLLGGRSPVDKTSELILLLTDGGRFAQDAFGSEATFDNSFVERDEGADKGPERWIFINGIATSRELARANVSRLRTMFARPFTLIHNPTQGLTNDLVESALEKFTNINTEPVARAFLEIASALVDDAVKNVVVIAHSQGTIIMGDVLDVLYIAIDRTLYDRTNMSDEDHRAFIMNASGTVKSAEMREAARKLKAAGRKVMDKLELYLFANAASRVCYIDDIKKTPHIESYANEHDIVTRLGSLARDDFHKEDLIRIDGSLFTCDRYGHLLNAHYLPDFTQDKYKLRDGAPGHQPCIGTSIHDPVHGNPCKLHPKYVPGPERSRLRSYYLKAQQSAATRQGVAQQRAEN